MTHPFTSTPSGLTGARIRELRERTGSSRRQVAIRAELHVSNLARIEQGASNPSLDTLARIAEALGTSVSDLVRDVRVP